MYQHTLRNRERGVSLLIMVFTLALLMGGMSLYLISAQQENLYMAAMERNSVINYWEQARYQSCLTEEGEETLCTYLAVE